MVLGLESLQGEPTSVQMEPAAPISFESFSGFGKLFQIPAGLYPSPNRGPII
jgi:hypothetical protein